MPRRSKAAVSAVANGEMSVSTNGFEQGSSSELAVLLTSLQKMRDGDFSVRLPGNWIGLEGKIADTFNEIVDFNQRLGGETARVSRAPRCTRGAG